MLLSMYKGIVTSTSSALTIHSQDLQSSLHSALSKDTALNTKKPTSIFSKQYGFPIVPPTHQQFAHLSRHNSINTKLGMKRQAVNNCLLTAKPFRRRLENTANRLGQGGCGYKNRITV